MMMIVIMKTNRQKTYPHQNTTTNPKGFCSIIHQKHTPTLSKHLTPTLSKQPTPTLSKQSSHQLKSLFNSHSQRKVVKVVCRGDLVLQIEEAKGKFKGFSQRKGKTVYLRCGNGDNLQDCLDLWLQRSQTVFILRGRDQEARKRSTRQWQQKWGQRKGVSKRGSYEQLNELSWRQWNGDKVGFALRLQGEQIEQNKAVFERCVIQKRQSENEGMFTVQQLKESMQSEMETMKSNKGKENSLGILNFDGIDLCRPIQTHLYHPKVSNIWQKDKQQQFNQPAQHTIMECGQQPPNCPLLQHSQPKSTHQKSSKDKVQIGKEAESRFSFATQMRKGLIETELSGQEPDMSFKIAGDSLIEDEKRRVKNEPQFLQMGQLSELSSIVSNARDDPLKKDTEQEADSMKHQLEDMRSCVRSVRSVPREEHEAVKVELRGLVEQREQQLDPSIHITEGQPNNCHQRQYTVRYDVRFMKRKEATEVTRLSPLRFDVKDRGLGQLVGGKVMNTRLASGVKE